MRVAARRAAGFFHPTQRTEVVWVDGDNELEVNLATLHVKLADGLIGVIIPVCCDQVGSVEIEVILAVATAASPSGLYASSPQRPRGPAVIVDAWGEALVAFGWQCGVGLVSGIAGATGKDARGNTCSCRSRRMPRGAASRSGRDAGFVATARCARGFDASRPGLGLQ